MFVVEVVRSADGAWTGSWTCTISLTYTVRSTVCRYVVIVHAVCVFTAAVAYHALSGCVHDGPDESLVAGGVPRRQPGVVLAVNYGVHGLQ